MHLSLSVYYVLQLSNYNPSCNPSSPESLSCIIPGLTSPQYSWLLADLKAVNRANTPCATPVHSKLLNLPTYASLVHLHASHLVAHSWHTCKTPIFPCCVLCVQCPNEWAGCVHLRWLVVGFHEPYYSTDSNYTLATYFQQNLEPLFYQYGVDLVMTGMQPNPSARHSVCSPFLLVAKTGLVPEG